MTSEIVTNLLLILSHLHFQRYLNLSSRSLILPGLIVLLDLFCIYQIFDTNLMIALLIKALRRRVGLVVSLMEGLSTYGPLLASTDSDAVAWCLNWNRGSSNFSLGDRTWTIDLGSGTRTDNALETMREKFSLSSTRNLVARTQILLDMAPQGMGPEKFKSFRAECEALLLLCGMLSHIK